jgi:glutathione S-transferase
MAIDIYWGSGSPYSWRVLLALEYKRIPYRSHLLQFSKQEHKSPTMLRMNPRGRLPVMKEMTNGQEFVCYESLAIMMYLDRKFPDPPIFGKTPEDAATVIRLISEYQSYAEEHIAAITRTIFTGKTEGQQDELAKSVQAAAKEARTIESRLATAHWLVGDSFSAADAVVFPGIQLLLRALERREAQDLRARFVPLDANFPSIAAWVRRIESLPGYDRTYPPHWRG